jgi:hypothetical protein
MVQGLRNTLIFRYQNYHDELDRRTRMSVARPAWALPSAAEFHSQNVSILSLAGKFSRSETTTPPLFLRL